MYALIFTLGAREASNRNLALTITLTYFQGQKEIARREREKERERAPAPTLGNQKPSRPVQLPLLQYTWGKKG